MTKIRFIACIIDLLVLLVLAVIFLYLFNLDYLSLFKFILLNFLGFFTACLVLPKEWELKHTS